MRSSALAFLGIAFAVGSSATALAQAPAQTPVATASEAPKAAPITLESFAAPPFLSNPSLSPNGQYLAARITLFGEQLLTIHPLYDAAQKPTYLKLPKDPKNGLDLDWWRWVNDDWLLIGLSATVNVEGEVIRVRRVGALQRGTGTLNKLAWNVAAQNADDVIWTAKDGSPRILMGLQRSIYLGPEFWTEIIEVDVSTGKFKTAQRSREGFSSYWADAQGVVRLGYAYDDQSRTSKLIYRERANDRLELLDTANSKKDESLTFPAMFLKEPGRALTIDNDEGFDAVYELDLTRMQKGKKLFDLKNYDIDGLVRSPLGDTLLGVSVTEDRPRVHWIDPAMITVQAELDKAFGAGRASILSMSQDMGQMLVQVGGPDQAGAYYVYNQAAGRIKRIGYVDEALKMQRMAPVSTISYTARDGLAIRAVLTLPKGKEAKNLPLIVLPHGGPEARDSEQWDWWVQFLAWRGYAVVQPNYRGSTGFGAKFFKMGDGQWGLKMQDDLNDVVTHLAKAGIADPKRVCMAGASYGGYAALRAAQRDGALYRCVISYAGVADLNAMRRYDSQFLNGQTRAEGWKQSAPDLSAVSPVKHAESFGAPALIMHGANDLRVPVRQSREMAQKLKAASKPYVYIEQKLGDHHFSRTEDRLQFLKEMDAFLSKYNPVN